MTLTNRNIRTYNSSAEAREAGFSTIEWLRAFTFQEHAERVRADASAPKWWEV